MDRGKTLSPLFLPSRSSAKALGDTVGVGGGGCRRLSTHATATSQYWATDRKQHTLGPSLLPGMGTGSLGIPAQPLTCSVT